MSLRLIAVTTDRDLLAALVNYTGDITHADTIEDAVTAYYDDGGVIALGPDTIQGYRGDGLPFDHYLIYTDEAFVDWEAPFYLGTVGHFELPAEMWALTTLTTLAAINPVAGGPA